MNDKKYTSISKVEPITIDRVSTGHEELDWLYGLSRFSDGDSWGMPVGTISTWCGEGGVGKSRLAISVAKNKVAEGKRVLYLQNEVDLPTLSSWVNDSDLDEFYCSEVTELSDQIGIILELEPDIVFVDSINLIDEFGTGTAKSIKTIIDGFRQAIKGTTTHVIILCQLNKEGSATGSTALGHLPDINFQLTNTDEDGVFRVGIGKKHRYGRKGSAYNGLWKHTETGVESVSNNRLEDDRWPKQLFADFGERRQRSEGIPGLDAPLSDADMEAGRQLVAGLEAGMREQSIKLVPSSLPPKKGYSESGYANSLETCSPAVKEAYYKLNPSQRPTLLNKIVKMYKKNWNF